ncbi:MAG TPA: hypothetical protein VHB21_27935, partial [Minicystis sp.]|nr:hypothetical protein [Minicystis sp.]
MRGIRCRDCAQHAERVALATPGVMHAEARRVVETLTAVFDARRASERDVGAALTRAGVRIDGGVHTAQRTTSRFALGAAIVLTANLVALSIAARRYAFAGPIALAEIVLAAAVLLLVLVE